MTFNNDYLSDEELNALIAETESEGLVQAPKGLHAEVMKKIDRDPAASQKERKADFYKFTYKVVLSVAAALLLMTLLPRTIDTTPRVPTKEEVMKDREREPILDKIEEYITEKGGILK